MKTPEKTVLNSSVIPARGLLLLGCIALASCSATGPQRSIPALDHFSSELADYDPSMYRVRRGESLERIAWRFRLETKTLAQWNGLKAPYRLQTGQKLRLNPNGNVVRNNAIKRQPQQVAQQQTRPPVKVVKPQVVPQPVIVSSSAGLPRALPVTALPTPRQVPPVVKQAVSIKATPAASNNKIASSTASTPVKVASSATPVSKVSNDSSKLRWLWPAKGKVSNGSSGSVGIEIAGSNGQAVYAAAPGRVVYSGNGLKGYGELIIIKHTDNILSAYAHSSERLIKEGIDVASGEKIALMGAADGQLPYVYFEIRKNGKPVDPRDFLPES